MTCSTAGDLSLLETLEQRLSIGVSLTLLAEIERELLRLRSEFNESDWKCFCAEFPNRGLFQKLEVGTLALRRLDHSSSLRRADLLDLMTSDSFPARPSPSPSSAHLINAWEYSLPASRSMRARKTYFGREIAEAVRTTVRPRILILGGGRLREADDAIHSAHLHHAQFVALEQDADNSAYLGRTYFSHPLEIEKGGSSDLYRLSQRLGRFDLIYSLAWLDTSDDSQAAEWLAAAADMLRGGGRLLAANFAPGSRDAGWIEACWNVHPHYRSEEQLAQLSIELKCPSIRGHAVFRDESGASAFLEVHAL